MSKAGNRKGERRLRVRTKRHREIDNTKLSLALWLIAKGIVEDKGDGTTDGGGQVGGDSSAPVGREDR